MQTKTKKILAAIGMMAVVVLLVGTAAGGRAPAPEVPASVASSGEEAESEPDPVSGQEASSAAPAAEAASGTLPEAPAPDEAPAETLPEEDADSAASEELLSGSTAASSAVRPAASSSAAASSHAASSVVKPSSSSSSAASSVAAQSGSEVDAWIDSYIRRIRALQRRSEKKLYQTASSAYSEYMSHPQKERNLGLKVSIVLSKTVELTNLQSECDKEFNAILKELRQYLKDNGRDQSIADEIEKEYKAEKDAMIKELTNLTYSQVTGKGEGGKWLAEHSDMAG